MVVGVRAFNEKEEKEAREKKDGWDKIFITPTIFFKAISYYRILCVGFKDQDSVKVKEWALLSDIIKAYYIMDKLYLLVGLRWLDDNMTNHAEGQREDEESGQEKGESHLVSLVVEGCL
jgi:hypothetical protein